MSTLIPLGPTLTGTIVTPDLPAAVTAYCEHLHAAVLEDTTVDAAQAQLWGKPRLEGLPLVTLQSPTGHPWVRFIGIPDLLPARPFRELGWMAWRNHWQALLSKSSAARGERVVRGACRWRGPPARCCISLKFENPRRLSISPRRKRRWIDCWAGRRREIPRCSRCSPVR